MGPNSSTQKISGGVLPLALEMLGVNYMLLFWCLPNFGREGRRVKVNVLIPLTHRLWILTVLLEDTWLIKFR